MESSDPGKGSLSLNDVMYRRLKNRERQRRYRQKKRLQADGSKVYVANQSSEMQLMSLPINVTVEQVVTRVHCKRDWKKDARRAHAARQEAKPNGLPSSVLPLANDRQLVHHPFGTSEAEQALKNEMPSAYVGNSESGRSKSGKRDWKAEARNKRN